MDYTYLSQRSGRLSDILRSEMHISTGLMNRAKWAGNILVNGIPQHTDFAVSPGDTVVLRMEEPAPDYPAENGPLTILYEDDWILAVDKPAGMLVHPSRSCNTGTLANFVAGYYAKTGQTAAFHPVTRLDRDTFGVVLVAKNSHIHAALQAEKAKKRYHALVYGCPEASEGIIDAPIARKPLPSLLREIHPMGKPSVTRYWTMEEKTYCTKLALEPVTGRTHQLRLHCAHIGCPILGDPQYGSDASQVFSASLGLTTQALCAHSISFAHPITGEPITITSTLDV